MPFPTGAGERHTFTHAGYTCAVQLGPYSYNGYIELPDGHPWLDYETEMHIPADVHGGITYRDGNTVGFDTNHYTDSPHPSAPNARIATLIEGMGAGRIWSQDAVIQETYQLAQEARRAEENNQ